MSARIVHIAFNTFREAVRDRVLYNLIAFALLLTGGAVLVGQISIDIERLVVINLGLTAVSLFGVVIAIFIGIGLVSKEIDKRTLYTVLSRPVQRWEFIAGKFFGLRPRNRLQRRFVLLDVPDFLVVARLGAGPASQDDPIEDELPDQPLILDHARVGQKFLQIDTYALGVGGIGRAEIDEEDADALRSWRGGGLRICNGNDRRHDGRGFARCPNLVKPNTGSIL